MAQEVKRRHMLAVIGWLGTQEAYLDIPLPDAKALYEQRHGAIADANCYIFSFDEMFGVSELWDMEEN